MDCIRWHFTPTNLRTELVRRYFTVATTITDEYTDAYLQSVFYTLTNNIADGLFRRYFTQSPTE